MEKSQWRKNEGLMSNLTRHRKNAYWSKACANRWIKRADETVEDDVSLLVIYHYPKWYIQAWREGNLIETIQARQVQAKS